MICRNCGTVTESVLDLGGQPFANNLLDKSSDSFEQCPLEVMYCPDCLLGQLRDLAQPTKLFSEYLFYSRASKPIVAAASDLVDRVMKKIEAGPVHESFLMDRRHQIIEIASNDGYMLQFYKERGALVLGVDPARGPANVAALLGIPTIQDFFGLRLAKTLPKADVVHAQNVLAHVPDLDDFIAGVEEILAPRGKFIVEVPYFGDMILHGVFDTVYHEHVYYFTFRSLENLLSRYGLYIAEWEHLNVLGGSLRLWIEKGIPEKSIADSGLEGIKDWQKNAKATAANLVSILQELKARGKRVWGYGAAAKTTVLMSYCGITADLIEAVADTTPAKLGKYIPGTGIQVRSEAAWLAAAPDYTCNFVWNYDIGRKYSDSYKGIFFTPYSAGEVFDGLK